MSVFLVIEPFGVIAEDLAQSIREYDPFAEVFTAPSAAEGVRAISGKGAVEVAFLHMNPEKFRRSQLSVPLSDSNTLCVFMGEAADLAEDGRCFLLDRPFSDATVAALLERILPRNRAVG